jgi:hypothetical protein
MKLNLAAGFLVFSHGMEANPEKIKDIECMRSPIRLKDIQRLIGCMGAIGRFISKLKERGFPLFRLLDQAVRPCRVDRRCRAGSPGFEAVPYLSSGPGGPSRWTPQDGEPLQLYIDLNDAAGD